MYQFQYDYTLEDMNALSRVVGKTYRRKKVLPLRTVLALMGAAYLMVIDNLCRLVSANEIPLGILTAVIGAPVFAYLLRKTRGGWQ